ncbi:MAG: hypothetical protein K1X29_03035 [Bdellovibrionales bacterium]|nr:hypothetical protein [Bdellovibrionales bacterium]
MFDALVVSTVNSMEFNEVRSNVVRIPEVYQRIREAQEVWDQTSENSLDLANFISSDDQTFLGNLRMKNLVTAVVQMGLLQRFLRSFKMPRLVAGLVNGDAPLKVISGQQSFDNMVRSSSALANGSVKVELNKGALPILSGISLAEFGLLSLEPNGEYHSLIPKEMDFRRLIRGLVNEPSVKKIAVLGPGQSHIKNLVQEVGSSAVEVVDTIALDPLLNWFWPAPLVSVENEDAFTMTGA